MYVAPKDCPQLSDQAVHILSVKELRNFTPDALEFYKVRVCNAKLKAATELVREAYSQQLDRVNTVLNERGF